MEGAGGNVDEWRGAALRLHGLAASFGAVRLMTLARSAIDGRPGDMSVIAKLRRAITRL
jgi:hypothetical protein